MNFGYTGDHCFENGDIAARVTAVHKDRYGIVCERGEGFARLKRGAYREETELWPTVGDFVRLQWNEMGDSTISQTLPRHSFFSRYDSYHRVRQAVAANFDFVFIVTSLNHDYNARRLERYLTMAWESGASPVIILTKADLVNGKEAVQSVEENALGVPVHTVSAITGSGLEHIRRYFGPGKTTVFLGSSGVGKSTLVNALCGREVMATGGIREADSKGRHTTTHRQMIFMDNGAMIIDTPGMRELAIWDGEEGLKDTFSDIEDLAAQCRFRDCSHTHEPGCAVQEAVKAGRLSEKRLKNYKTLLQEARRTHDLQDAMRKKQEWSKQVAKAAKQRKKRY